MDEEEVRNFLKVIFEAYQRRKKNNALYNDEDQIPQNIITMYYNYIRTPDFIEIVENFKKKYIFNETSLENGTNNERLGLGKMYDYIEEYDCNEKFNLYMLLKLHQLIFSKCYFPGFGGTFRNDDVYLPGSGVVIPEHDIVPELMTNLYKRVETLLAEIAEHKNKDTFDVILYINKCVEINCEIIHIHPFFDGNGRSARGFLNLLFKNIGLPPVYVETREKSPYCLAMNKAITENDYKDIYKFYYYKICDSIYELDIKAHEKMENNNNQEGVKTV